MTRHRAGKWVDYTIVEDLAIKLDVFMSKIGPVDPVTGCQYQLWGSKHNQGYMMHNAHHAYDYGSNEVVKGLMVTGHRVLARLKYKRPITPKDIVYHTCGDMRCLNSDHIRIGVFTDMTKIRKGRGPARKPRLGHRQLKFTIEQLFWAREHTTKEITKTLGIDSHRSWELKNNLTKGYKWLDVLYNRDGTRKT